jgi:hypothetical protein
MPSSPLTRALDREFPIFLKTQTLDKRMCYPRVGGSIPPLGTKIRHSLDLPQAFAALAFANGENHGVTPNK